MEHEKEYYESNEPAILLEKEEKEIEEGIALKGDSVSDDEARELLTKKLKINFIGQLFNDENSLFNQGLMALKEVTVLKMPRIL